VIKDIIQFITAHAAWAGPIIFLVAFGESFAFISFLFPGTAIMLAAGAFIPSGTLSAWPLIVGAICGAVLGDTISYEIGRRYGHHLKDVWPFKRRPDLLERGVTFSGQHGGKAVFAGRFFGPFRAVVPLAAGCTRLSRRAFWIANVTSALIWAPGLLLPGVATAFVAERLHASLEQKILIFGGALVLVLVAVWAAHRTRIWQRLFG
jgi:membrane protein DedA with SNARE-associated domain